jgi:hypothetical protein
VSIELAIGCCLATVILLFCGWALFELIRK